jgi:hypothetical protein
MEYISSTYLKKLNIEYGCENQMNGGDLEGGKTVIGPSDI